MGFPRVVISVLTAVGVLIASPAAASLEHADAAAGRSGATIWGAGKLTFGGGFFVRALDSPEGDSGTLMTTSVAGDTPQQLVLELDCVHVVGNTALVSGTVIRGTEGYVEVGQRVWYLLADRGTAADQPADGITSSFGVAEPNCELVEGPFFSFVNVQAGDITINTT